MWHNLLMSYVAGKSLICTVFSNVLTDNVKIHVVVYMKKDSNFIRAMLKQYWNLSGKVA